MVSKPKKPKAATPDQLLQETVGYDPAAYYGTHYRVAFGRPPFSSSVVTEMLTDPRVIYGLWIIKGPILSNAHVKVDCANIQVKDFLVAQINRFWMNSAVRALKALEWGRSGSEVIYREKDGLIHFDELRDFHTPDVEPVVLHGRTCGILVKNKNASKKVYLGFPKAMLHLHWRERNRYHGMSRLFGVHIPWWETWSDGGYRDIRRLWYYKNSFEGGIIRHPTGTTKGENGVPQSNRNLARSLVEKKRSGGVMTLPNTTIGDSGNYAWTYEPPVANPAPEGLLEYGETLRDEVLEAMGIPGEIIASGGDQGFGSSTGRQVPQLAFYSILQELLQWLIYDLDICVLRGLVETNFGPGIEYDILPFKLSEDLSEPTQGNAEDFNGNQFQDENQRDPTLMSHKACIDDRQANKFHFRRGRTWYTADTKARTVQPMLVAV